MDLYRYSKSHLEVMLLELICPQSGLVVVLRYSIQLKQARLRFPGIINKTFLLNPCGRHKINIVSVLL